MPTVRNIEVKDMTVENGGETGVLLEGYEESPVQNLRLINVKIKNVKVPYKFSNVKEIEFENVTINGKQVVLPDSISPEG